MVISLVPNFILTPPDTTTTTSEPPAVIAYHDSDSVDLTLDDQ
jgi:hypothetical protein